MREILFRGQTRKKGEKVWLDGTPVDGNWVFGGVNQGKGDFSIIYQSEPEVHKYPVYTDTLGQYTGLTDKNGVKIFEGDIVKMHFEGTRREYDGDFSEHCYDVDFDGYKIGVVTFGGYGTFLKASHGGLYEDGEKVEDWKPARRSRLAAYRSEVIGNIHDNPELMGGTENA